MDISLETINERALDPAAFIAQCDTKFNTSLDKIADYIQQHRNEKPVILLAGPSGSGKTYTAAILERLLEKRGCATLKLSADNFFRTCTDRERALLSSGKLDLEAPVRLDIDLLNIQLNDLLSGRSISLTSFDFINSTQVPTGETYTKADGELILLEGIHALNPDVVKLPDEKTVKIYASVRTRVEHNGEVLHPSKIRLLRRMLRDHSTRGKSFEKTYGMFESVQLGENRYIMPYKSRADFNIDTFQAYELGIYKKMMYNELTLCGGKIRRDESVCFLRNSVPIDPSLLNDNSLVCEFACKK